MWDAAGQPVRMAGSIRDITDHKQLQESLNEAEAHYRTVVEHANDAIVILQDGKRVYWNPLYEQLMGYTVSDIGERSFWNMSPPKTGSGSTHIISAGCAGSPPQTTMKSSYSRARGSG